MTKDRRTAKNSEKAVPTYSKQNKQAGTLKLNVAKKPAKKRGEVEINAFGRKSRELRKKRKMLMGDVADALGISAAYLSQMETGKRKISDGIVGRICSIMSLDAKEAEQLQTAANISRNRHEVQLPSAANENDRVLARQLAVGFARLTEAQKRRIREILEDQVDE